MTSTLLTPYLDPDTQSVVEAYLGLDEYQFLRVHLKSDHDSHDQPLWEQFQYRRDPSLSWHQMTQTPISARFFQAKAQVIEERRNKFALWSPEEKRQFQAACQELEQKHQIYYNQHVTMVSPVFIVDGVNLDIPDIELDVYLKLFDEDNKHLVWQVCQTICQVLQQHGFHIEWTGQTKDIPLLKTARNLA